MVDILGSVTSAFGILKTIRELTDPTKQADLKLAIADLTEQLAEIKLRATDLATENADLKKEIQRLSTPPDMTYRNGAYFNGADGPYCPTCYDQGRKVRMQEMSPTFRAIGRYQCNACDCVIQ